MKKNKLILIIALVILIGMSFLVTYNYASYSKIINDDVLNISKLTSTNIYSEINNELIKPIFVSLTMANDSFLIDWLENEDNRNEKELIEYLDGIERKYDYNSVFLVSNSTKNYYHYNGIFKKVSSEDAHDVWYFDFLNAEGSYDLDVDQDEVDNQELTIFVNSKIYDSKGNILGVTGVGVQMEYIQSMLREFEKNFDLEAFLVNDAGLIQAHTNQSYIEKRNIFEEDEYIKYKKDIIDKKYDLMTFATESYFGNQYVITRYIDEFDWYLIVRSDARVLKKAFQTQAAIDIIILVLVIAIVSLIIMKMIFLFQREIIGMAKTDQLTGILNRRGFDEFLKDEISGDKKEFSLFIMDIDRFKDVNDSYGHLFGDQIIKEVASETKKTIGDKGTITRWGGDEFAGITREENPYDILENLRKSIEQREIFKEIGVTVTIGFTKCREIDTADAIVRRADRNMYKAKEEGRNKIKGDNI